MLCPERDKIRLGFHKCLGSRRPMLCPEREEIRLGFYKCLTSDCDDHMCSIQTYARHLIFLDHEATTHAPFMTATLAKHRWNSGVCADRN